LKKHLTPSTVISCIALFVALSGAAYAATLGKNAVKTRNIAKGAVTAAKIRNSGVTAAKIANGAVGSSKLADASVRSNALGGGVVTTGKVKDLAVTEGKLANSAVTAAKLSASAVETGKLAKEAVTGEKLSSGLLGQLVKNVDYQENASVTDTEEVKSATAQCLDGKQAIGGGARVNNGLKEVAITASLPFVNPEGKRSGWTATARETTPTTEVWSVSVFAICAEL
jgi:hypothetical protein